jgi:DNA-binding transcriptional regulator YhcF (GntR family)
MSINPNELLTEVEKQYVVNMRPATLQELAETFGVVHQTVRNVMMQLVEEGSIVKLYGHRCYAPAWIVQAIAEEGLKRIQDPQTREKIIAMVKPVKARLVDCMRNQFGAIEFPNPSTNEQRMEIAHDHFYGTKLGVQAILPTEEGYDIIVVPGQCDCGSYETSYKCPDCGAWICESCQHQPHGYYKHVRPNE